MQVLLTTSLKSRAIEKFVKSFVLSGHSLEFGSRLIHAEVAQWLLQSVAERRTPNGFLPHYLPLIDRKD